MNYRTLALTLLLMPLMSNILAQESQTDQAINPAEVINEVQQTQPGAAESTAIKPNTMKPQTRYVADEFYVPLRETPCGRCKIVHRGLKTGTKLMLLDLQDGWGQVKTEKGLEGWMEEQFLSDSQIARVQVVKDKAMIKKLKRRNNELEQVMSELRQQSKSLRCFSLFWLG